VKLAINSRCIITGFLVNKYVGLTGVAPWAKRVRPHWMSAILFTPILLEVDMSDKIRFLLNESDLPTHWYNINADHPIPPTPVLNLQTLEPVTPDFLSVLFPMELILQEISTERFI
jgi:hypothetical protein